MLAMCLALGACSVFQWPEQVRGNKVDPDQLKELVPGTSTRDDVTALIGSPTARATFDDNTWIYVTQQTRPRIARTLGVVSQTVVVMNFNDQGVLQTFRTLDQADALPVEMASQTTPSPGTEASFMQQLLGNIGRYNPGAALGGASFGGNGAPSGGAPSSAH
jgi:outer membrane protein assembly factor BamE (lipoprotein component of BamABCDE complex)